MNPFSMSLLLFGEGYETPTDFVDLIIRAEELNYEKVWLGEHYTFNNLWCNPEPLLPVALSYTSKISIGCAGLLVRLHSSYRIANNFKLLSSIFPNRVDLGYAAGNTGFSHLNNILVDTVKDFSEAVSQIHHFLDNSERLLIDNIPVAPYLGNIPNQWLLMGGYKMLGLALDLQLNVSRSIFHRGVSLDFQRDTLLRFKEQFFITNGFEPKINLAFSGVCHSDKFEAKKIYRESTISKSEFIVPNIIGTPSEFIETIGNYQMEYGIDDFVFMNLAERSIDKLIGMELLSNIFKKI